jgi:hypothetical protein
MYQTKKQKSIAGFRNDASSFSFSLVLSSLFYSFLLSGWSIETVLDGRIE